MKPRTRFRGLVAFVTVGTTRFDSLIRAVFSEDFCSILVDRGFVRLVVQAGVSVFEQEQVALLKANHDLEIVVYDYKDSIEEDIQRADLIIGHAGAGTCLEVLRASKRLLLVVNDTLMDNHQSELADELTAGNYVIQTTTDNLKQNFEAICDAKLNQFPQPSPSKFEEIFNEALRKVTSRL